MNILAAGGWGISSSWFAGEVEKAFPVARVRVIAPPAGGEQLLAGGDQADLYLGYSLGSLWLLEHRHHIPARAAKALLAPILAFPREKGLGGKISATELRVLIRSLSRGGDARDILSRFHVNAGLGQNPALLPEAPDIPQLIRGLEYLRDTLIPGDQTGGFIALIGDADPLLDAQAMTDHVPRLEIVKESGHAPLPLLKRLARLMPR
jgi:hypothetical protein